MSRCAVMGQPTYSDYICEWRTFSLLVILFDYDYHNLCYLCCTRIIVTMVKTLSSKRVHTLFAQTCDNAGTLLNLTFTHYVYIT